MPAISRGFARRGYEPRLEARAMGHRRFETRPRRRLVRVLRRSALDDRPQLQRNVDAIDAQRFDVTVEPGLSIVTDQPGLNPAVDDRITRAIEIFGAQRLGIKSGIDDE